MTPVQAIIMLSLYVALELLSYYMGWNKINKTTKYDSPKKDYYYLIGDNLNTNIGAPQRLPQEGNLILVDVIEETNTYVWARSTDIEDISYS